MPVPVRGAEAISRIAAWAQARGLDVRHDPATGFGATFSACGTWRYLLWRIAHPRAAICGMGLLNPSTADHRADDPTIRRCRARARQAGCAGLLVWNLFAIRATWPADLRRADDPIGPANDEATVLALALCRRTILGWGNHGLLHGRDRAVLAMCGTAGHGFATLGMTAANQPRHPLYLPSATRLRAWRAIPD